QLDVQRDPAALLKPAPGTPAMVSTFDQAGGNTDWTELKEDQVGPDGLVTLAEFTGPGCVTRIWNTSVGAKEWHFFFDGESEARLVGSTQDFFGGKHPFVAPLAGIVSGGFYSYVPLPYQSSLRIAIKANSFPPGQRRYFHVNYDTYPAETDVTSYPAVLSPEETGAIDDVISQWSQIKETYAAIGSAGEAQRISLPSGEQAEWLNTQTAGTLKSFSIGLNISPSADPIARDRVLRDLVLEMYWDGMTEPSVQVPLGDFFGNPFYTRRFTSSMFGLVDGRYICRFPMPYQKGARAVIRNDGPTEVAVDIRHQLGPAAESAYGAFHAAFKSETSQGGVTRQFPYRILSTKGHGRYLGCFLTAMSTDTSWFILEGDEQIRLDGSMSPSFHGTGLEDYFNGGWYYSGIFDLPYHGLIGKRPVHTDQYRLHIPDPVTFNTEVSVNIEFGDGNKSKGYMSSVAFWYQEPAVKTPYPVPATFDRRLPADPKEKDAIMAELFELERLELFEEARQRCEHYAFRFSELADTLEFRATGYMELQDGFAAVKPLYEVLKDAATDPLVRTAVGNYLNMKSIANYAVVAVNGNGRSMTWIDAKPLTTQISNPNDLYIRATTIQPGEHVISAQITPARADAWYTLHLQTSTTNLVADGTWECTEIQPQGWPDAYADTNVVWQTVPEPTKGDMLPRQGFWKMKPNGWVNTQSGEQLLRPWKTFKNRQAIAYLRKTITLPANQPK
ncbi:MAG: hypothetical protein ACI97B_004597, partial [Verrucomicrobiales bacterium]